MQLKLVDKNGNPLKIGDKVTDGVHKFELRFGFYRNRYKEKGCGFYLYCCEEIFEDKDDPLIHSVNEEKLQQILLVEEGR